MTASASRDLREMLLDKFATTFVGWSEEAGIGDRWRIEPYAGAMSTINVLVDRNRYTPSVWVFDPYLIRDAVAYSVVRSPGEIDVVVGDVQGRVRRAILLHRSMAVAPPILEREARDESPPGADAE